MYQARWSKTSAHPRASIRDGVFRSTHTDGLSSVMSSSHDRLQGVLKELGVARVPGVLSYQRATALREFILDERRRCSTALQADYSLDPLAWFSTVLMPSEPYSAPTRFDFKLPFSAIVQDTVRELLAGDGSKICSLLETVVGLDGELCELAALISEPGAVQQIVHSDVDYSPSPSLFSVFVALQDIACDMGPTRFLLRSHCDSAAHVNMATQAPAVLARADMNLALLGVGDAVVYDSRLLHNGEANRSATDRVIFYMTFRHPNVEATGGSADQPSIRAEYRDRFRLRDLSASRL